MPFESSSAPDAATPRHSPARRVLFAVTASSTIALLLNAPSSGQHEGTIAASAMGASIRHAVAAAPDKLRHESIPLFLGFVEFDWDPGHLAGFGPLPTTGSRTAHAHTIH